MRTILAVAFLTLSSMQAQNLAALTSGLMTGINVNGRYWNTLSVEAKATYLIAVNEGIGEVVLYAAKDCNCAFDASLNALRAIFGGTDSSYLEVAEILDSFYKDAANRPIPVIRALKYVTLKIKGAGTRELEDVASKLRKDANP